jgi:hypothetical protein
MFDKVHFCILLNQTKDIIEYNYSQVISMDAKRNQIKIKN